MNVVFVVNPASAAGKTGSDWPEIKLIASRFLDRFDHHLTNRPKHATLLAREALEKGCKAIVAVGGDGTLSEVVNAFFQDKKNIFPDAALGFIPCGTGGDFRRTLGWDSDVQSAVKRISNPVLKSLDVGHVEFSGSEGKSEQYFVNISSCGTSGLVAKTVNEFPKFMGSLFTFYAAAVYGMLDFRLTKLRVKCDDGPWQDVEEVNSVAICNGKYFGGGMKVAPDASFDDGIFDVTIWTNYNIMDFVTKSQSLYDGSHVREATTKTFKGKRVQIEQQPSHTENSVVVELDGEAPGTLPATWTILPGAIQFLS